MWESIQQFWQSARKLITVLVVVGALGAGGYAAITSDTHDKIAVLQQKLDRNNLEIDRLKRGNRHLRLLITNVSTSDSLVEKIAREDAGLIKQGELLYIFPH